MARPRPLRRPTGARPTRTGPPPAPESPLRGHRDDPERAPVERERERSIFVEGGSAVELHACFRSCLVAEARPVLAAPIPRTQDRAEQQRTRVAAVCTFLAHGYASRREHDTFE